MNRVDLFGKINTYAARFVLEVEGYNATNQYHVNIHAESFLIPVLNEVFGLELENLNSTQRKNFPAIDLADFKNRVAFQVTASSDFAKIEHTLETFFRHGLNKDFDVLYVYIITHKKEKYNDGKLKKYLPDNFSFSSSEHVIDKDVLLQKINEISSTPKLQVLAKLFEHEFSDAQTELRKKEFSSGYLRNETENIFPNLLRVNFPETLYKAELNIDGEKILSDLNEYLVSIGKKPIKKMREAKLVKKALKRVDCTAIDWLLFEKWIYTFRNLNDEKEPIRKIVDKGTITPLQSRDFYESSDDKERVFKNLLRKTLNELCIAKQIEWFGKKEVFRFANNQISPNQKKVKWKGKHESTKTVIFEMFNEKEGHIICFRSLAFRASFLRVSDDWFLVLNPTWSFTNPGGYNQSRFEPGYMTGLKKLENNKAVFNYYRFFGYYLSYTDLFTPEYPYLRVGTYYSMPLSPRLEESLWKPVKTTAPKAKELPADIKEDNELFDNTLFE